MLFKWLILSKGGVDDVGHEPTDSSDNAVSVAMAHWNVEHRVFAVEQFFRNGDSVVTVQRSPDLSICDFFFLWGYLKFSVHEQTMHDQRAETFHSPRNRSCARKNVGACDAGL
jgi:hypothetical protein